MPAPVLMSAVGEGGCPARQPCESAAEGPGERHLGVASVGDGCGAPCSPLPRTAHPRAAHLTQAQPGAGRGPGRRAGGESHTHTHTHTYAHIYTCTHAHIAVTCTLTHARLRTHACTHSHTDTCTQTHLRSAVHATHTCIHTHAHVHVCRHAYAHTDFFRGNACFNGERDHGETADLWKPRALRYSVPLVG